MGKLANFPKSSDSINFLIVSSLFQSKLSPLMEREKERGVGAEREEQGAVMDG